MQRGGVGGEGKSGAEREVDLSEECMRLLLVRIGVLAQHRDEAHTAMPVEDMHCSQASSEHEKARTKHRSADRHTSLVASLRGHVEDPVMLLSGNTHEDAPRAEASPPAVFKRIASFGTGKEGRLEVPP